jgi:hypothetical protein
MNVLEGRYREVLAHLKRAYRAMRPLADLTDDWTAAVEVREEFQHLRRKVREFARCQHGIGATGRRRRM